MIKRITFTLFLTIVTLSLQAQNTDQRDSIVSLNPVCEFITTPNGGEVNLNQHIANHRQMAPVWDGSGSETTSILAKGISLSKKGLGFSGYAGYERGKRLNTAWSNVAAAPEYYPYLVADSIGGDYRHERYLLGGAFQMQHNSHRGAIRIDYDGSVHWRSTDPRPKNTVSNMGLTLGYMHHASFGLIGAALSLENRKQHADIRIEEDKRKDRFYQLLGMGLFDHRYSTVESSFSRYYRGMGMKAEISFAQQISKGWYARIQFENSRMDVEESDTRISAFSKRTGFASSLGYQLNTSEDFRWDNRLEISYRKLKGFEQVYKIEQSNAQTGVFVPVLLDKSQRTVIQQPEITLRSMLHLTGKQILRSAGLHAGWSGYEETYNPYAMKWTALKAGGSYKLTFPLKKKSFEIRGQHDMLLNLSKSLHTPEANRIVEEMIRPNFRYFTRSALYNELKFSYHHRLKHVSLTPSVKLQGEFTTDNRKALALTVGFKINM